MASAGNLNAASAPINDTYERNPVNNSALGTEFETNVAIYSVLTLLNSDQQAIAIQYELAPAKFDDVVLRVRKDAEKHEYFFRQLKHRDTNNKQSPEAFLTWDKLLKTKIQNEKNPPFGLPYYYKSFLEQKNRLSLNDVKELGFVTNIKLDYNMNDSSSLNNLRDLADLAKRLLYSTQSKNNEQYITKGDLQIFFREWSDPSSWRPPSGEQKSYRFTEDAVKAIFEGTEAALDAVKKKTQNAAKKNTQNAAKKKTQNAAKNKTQGAAQNDTLDLTLYKQYLGLLVFHVAMPHVEKLKTLNQQLLKLYFPFHKKTINERYADIEANFTKLFDKIASSLGKNSTATSPDGGSQTSGKNQAKWATVERRRELFKEMASSWGKEIFVELLANHQQFQQADYEAKPELDSIFREIFDAPKPWAVRIDAMPVVNIYNADSDSLTIALKALKTLEYYALNESKTTQYTPPQGRFKIMQVSDKQSVDNIIRYFKDLNEEVSSANCPDGLNIDSFCYIIQIILPFNEWTETTQAQMVQSLSGLIDLRKWIRFVIITQQPMLNNKQVTDLLRIEDDPLPWQNLSENYNTFLFEKTLHVCDNKETSLRALGFEQKTIGEWLQPRALSELIVHDDKKPLYLGLPKKDASLETDYIERDIQLPLVKNKLDRKYNVLYTCTKAEFDRDGSAHMCRSAKIAIEYQHLLSPVDSKIYKNACLWVKSKEAKSILDLHQLDFVVHAKASDVTKHETDLLKEDVNFGTGSPDNKLLVVVDYPGKGKSCLLTSLSNQFLDEWGNKTNGLLLRVNLREIEEWKNHKNGVEFIQSHATMLKKNLTIERNCLAAAIFNRKCSNGRPPSVFVLLDGYDEIGDEQRIITLDVIDDLKKMEGIKRIILTSRPEADLENELEQRYRQFSLHLKNFDKKDQIRYLTKRWTLKVKKTKSDRKIEKYAGELVDFASKTLKDENNTFLDVPLQCWIFSECFYQQLEEYLMSGNETVPQFSEESFEILNLYDRFFEAKVDILLQEKANIPPHGGNNETLIFLRNDMGDVYLRSLERLSVFHVIGKKDDAECLCRLSWENYKSGMKKYSGKGADIGESERDLRRAIKLGVLQECPGDDKPFSASEPRDIKFLHRTFAEYFFARYLFRNLIQEKSELFDDDISRQELIDKRFEIITKQILVAPEFAGVRRFLVRMLTKQVPPAGEPCPFANEARSDVLKKWPVIGHERFNEQLAKAFILQNATGYEELSFRNYTSASQLSEEHYQQLIKQGNDSRRRYLAIISGVCFKKEPFLTSMLLHCIKEYACRQDGISDEEREKLAYSVTLSSLNMVLNTANYEEKTQGEITHSIAHWFDPAAAKLPTTTNHVASKWMFIFLNAARVESGSECFNSDFVAAMCKVLEYHENYPDFEESIYAIAVSRLFATKNTERNNVKSYNTPFFRIFYPEIWFEEKEKRVADILFEGIFDAYLGARIVSYTKLLQRLADFLVRVLSQHREHADQYLERLNDLRDSLKNAGNLRNESGDLLQDVEQSLNANIDSSENFVLENVVRPHAFMKTIKFFNKAESKLPEPAVVNNLRRESLEYIARIHKVLIRMIHLGNLSQVMHLPKYCGQGQKNMYSSTMYWYFLVSNEILSNVSDDTRTQSTRNIFFTDDIGQKSLTAYAHATCCCLCKDGHSTGFGIHFPQSLFYESDLIVGPFRGLFADKLKFLWNDGKAEIEFIDFLFKECEFVTKDEREFERSTEDQSTGSAQPMCNTLEEAESILRAIQLSKMPCLLFSDVVAEYIPQKLSPTGLHHLIDTLKAVPLISCERNCFSWMKEGQFIPVATNLKKSIFDGIMQENVTSPSRIISCKKGAARMRALQEKLNEANHSTAI